MGRGECGFPRLCVRAVAVVSFGLAAWRATAAQAQPVLGVQVVAESNRSVYYAGEPVVLRWRLRNNSRSDWPIGFAAIGITHGFSLWYRFGTTAWVRDTRAEAHERPDRAFIRTPLAVGSIAERVDLFMPEETGKYEIKVVVDAEEQGMFESEPLAFEVVLPPADEPLLALLGGDSDGLKYVGLYIFYSHYGGGPHAESSYVVEGRNGTTIMKGIAPLISQAEAAASASRYLPYLQYAFVCNNASDPLTSREVTALLRRRAEALWSNSDPTFWLKPQAGVGLFNVYRGLGLTQQARTVGEQLLQNWPQSAFLRESALEKKLQALPAL